MNLVWYIVRIVILSLSNLQQHLVYFIFACRWSYTIWINGSIQMDRSAMIYSGALIGNEQFYFILLIRVSNLTGTKISWQFKVFENIKQIRYKILEIFIQFKWKNLSSRNEKSKIILWIRLFRKFYLVNTKNSNSTIKLISDLFSHFNSIHRKLDVGI